VRVITTSARGSEAPLSGFSDQELYQHLRRRRLTLPTLVERAEDLPDLVEHFVQLHARRTGKPVQRISKDSMERLKAYEWPGNIQELSNIIEQSVVTARGSVAEINEAALDEGTPVGSYRLIELLGAGGMGEVWRAKHRLLARPAAVKLIRASALGHSGDDRRLIERFQREAVATANLRSPHTVQLFDFGISEAGSFYYVMELLEGMDLDKMVKQFGPLPPERVVSLLRQACRSLIEAHDAGLVHRDIKPANLYVCRLGPEVDFLKVLDFGMVKAIAAGDQTQLSTEGTARGTPAFMPPELAVGESEVDGRADIYALGCVAYWLLTGCLVFEAKSHTQMMMHHVHTPPVPPSRTAEHEIPESLERIVLSCLEKSKEKRPPTALDLWQLLGSVEFGASWTQERSEHWWKLHVP
jgi:serine/threonine-protein kinase